MTQPFTDGTESNTHPTRRAPGESEVIPLVPVTPVDNNDEAPTVITQNRPPSAPLINIGKKLAHFEILQPIGSGGMASVFKAHDPELGRIVALKILPPDAAQDPNVVARFKSEGKATAKLDHPHIARAFHCGEHEGLHFIAFEYIEGENLLQRLGRLGVLDNTTALNFLTQLSSALEHAADRGVVHRDIKPSNIILTPDGNLKIVDMGLARQAEDRGLTHSGITMGTFDYISPEQALDPRNVDIRADIYSLGCTFYHLLTGVPPVPEGTPTQKLQAQLNDKPIDPRDRNRNISDGLAKLLAKMMAKQASHRYQTPKELSDAIAELVHAVPTSATSGITKTRRSPEPEAMNPALGLLGVLFAIVALIGTIYFTTNDTPPLVSTAQPWPEPARSKGEVATPKTLASIPTPRPATRIADARQLAERLQELNGESGTVKLRRGVVYHVEKLPSGLSWHGEMLTIEADDTESDIALPRPIIRVHAFTPGEDADKHGTAQLHDAAKLTLKGIDLEIVDRAPAENIAAEQDPVGLWLNNVRQIDIENCVVRSSPEARRQRLVGIGLERDPGAKPPSMTVRHSIFDVGNQSVAIRIEEQSELKLREVGFAPHHTGVLLTDDSEGDTPTAEVPGLLDVRSCTFLFDRGGAAITTNLNVATRLAISASVFADLTKPLDDKMMMPNTDLTAQTAAALRTEGDGESQVRWATPSEATPNAYFHVRVPTVDARAIVSTRSPCLHDDPRALLPGGNPWDAFQLRLDDKRLRVNGSPFVLGMATQLQTSRGTPRPIYAGSWPPPKPEIPVRAAANQRVVHPDATPEDAAQRLYPTFAQAYADLREDETLLIAANGPTPLGTLPDKAVSATIQAAPGFQPVLVSSDTGHEDAPLLKLSEGELKFLNVQIQLVGHPSFLSLLPGCSVEFKNCVCTLGTRTKPTTLIEYTELPSNKSTDTKSKVTIANSFLRGHGNVLSTKSLFALECRLTDSLLVMDGTILRVMNSERDRKAAFEVLFQRSTLLATGNAVEIHSHSARSTPVDVLADRCLFASFGRRNDSANLVELHDADTNGEPGGLLNWKADGPNHFGQYETLLDQRYSTSAKIVDWDIEKWMRITNETGRSAAVRFATPPTTGKVRKLLPENFKAEYEASSESWKALEAGADLTKLPKPITE